MNFLNLHSKIHFLYFKGKKAIFRFYKFHSIFSVNFKVAILFECYRAFPETYVINSILISYKKNHQNLLFCTPLANQQKKIQNVYKIARLLKQEKWAKIETKKKYFRPLDFFSCLKSCVCHYIFLWHYFPPPSFHKFLCVLDIKKIIKRKRTCFFSTTYFEKKVKKLISTTTQQINPWH